jgi:catechol 2,3-dioxygenase-like lactoylglutathione lyase family enzyme
MTTRIDRRHFLATLPALALAPRAWAQSSGPPLRVRGLSQMTLTVSDMQRSLAFYQGLFGMPIQARQGTSVLLRVGDGPQFLALKQAAPGESPSISAFGMAVEDFDPGRAMTSLMARGVSRAASGTGTAGVPWTPMTARLASRLPPGGASGESTQELFAADPSGIVFQLHDPAYCGGTGAKGTVCSAPEPSRVKGLFAVRDLSHFTINVSDQERTVAFYQALFGFEVQVRQGAAPAYGVGPGVQFLMFAGGAPAGRAGGGPPREGGPAAPPRGGAPAAPRAGGPAAGAAPPRGPRIDHACLSMNGFNPEAVTKTLVGYGLTQQANASREPRVTYISLRMPNRGGAEGGTPELYLTDPDGLAIQLQDVSYCGGGGFLGDVCPPL